jgi:cell wall assembly regulator SMI1
MSVLSIRHYETAGDRLAQLTWNGDEYLQASQPFAPHFDTFDLEDVRWYHENYRRNWRVSSNSAIQRIQRAERNLGEALHAALFRGSAAPLAEKVRHAGPDLRIEIRDEVHSAAIPWELIADPEAEQQLALTAASFVRVVGSDLDVPAEKTTHRLLLLISRPGGEADPGYWSVAYSLWRELARLPAVKVDVLRPPTFDDLERHLSEAKRNGAPYAAVHFDGHGRIMNPFGGRTRGYLGFETPGRADAAYIDGATIGRVLAASGVVLFSMNACRSADSKGSDRHLRATREPAIGQPSIVEDVLTEGVPACIGMREEIYPGTAARFFRAFYPEFFAGRSAGEAARIARAQLHEEPLAMAAPEDDLAPIHDWSIPVVGERAVVRLLNGAGAQQNGAGAQEQENKQYAFPPHLTAPAIIGFDRAILKLEDMMAQAPVVLVHGPLLSGKSRLAVEYAKWLSATSPAPRPVRYIRLSASDTPDALAPRMSPDGIAPIDPAEYLNGWGGILILDQADHLAPETETFLGDVLARLDGACRVVVTARAGNLPWLPRCGSVVPDALSSSLRSALGRLWADAAGSEFDNAELRPLLFFSGGLPGMILLLLGASHELRRRHQASAKDVAFWLHSAQWDRISELSGDPGAGLPPVGRLADEVAGDLSSTCDAAELAVIRMLSRFHVCFSERSIPVLMAAVSGTELSAAATSSVIGKLAAAGLAKPTLSEIEPSWFLHPLLKLVASRLPEAADDDVAQGAVIDAVARTCAELTARFRTDTAEVVDMLDRYEQNMSDALYLALKRGQLQAAAHVAEGICLHSRFTGNVDMESRVLDHALPYFIDTTTGMLLPECGEIGLRVWDQAIWVAPNWPRKRGPMGNDEVSLRPPENDNYAAGLWFRGIRDMDKAAAAFRAELASPAERPRYAPRRRRVPASGNLRHRAAGNLGGRAASESAEPSHSAARGFPRPRLVRCRGSPDPDSDGPLHRNRQAPQGPPAPQGQHHRANPDPGRTSRRSR